MPRNFNNIYGAICNKPKQRPQPWLLNHNKVRQAYLEAVDRVWPGRLDRERNLGNLACKDPQE